MDAFSLGVMLHYTFTCCNPDWQPAFDPSKKAVKTLECSGSPDMLRAIRIALAEQHASWVSMCADWSHASARVICRSLPVLIIRSFCPTHCLVLGLAFMLASSTLSG